MHIKHLMCRKENERPHEEAGGEVQEGGQGPRGGAGQSEQGVAVTI